jgi:glycosyltransferase involved in cell wall biosynthesis
MRILQATDCYPPPLIGGRDLHVRMLAHELSGRGHEVQVVTLAGPEGPHAEMDGNIQVHRIAGWSRALSRFYVNPQKPFHPTVPDPGVVRSLARLIKQFRPEIIHVHSWMLHSFLPIVPTVNTRVVVTMHEYGLVCPKNTFMHKGGLCDGPRFAKCIKCSNEQYGAVRATALTTGIAASHRSILRVNRYVAVSTPVAQASETLLRDSSVPVAIIPPFLADDSFELGDQNRPSFLPSTGDFVMFAGSLTPHKGIDILLDAWGEVDPAVPLVLVGLRGHDTPASFPDGVIVAEDVSHPDVMRAWRNCTIAVVPSCWPEPVGLVALEAMAAGRPVIASAVGGLAELIQDDVTGILVNPGDRSALRTSIRRLLADPKRRRRLGEAARERSFGYAASEIVPRIEAIYTEALAAPPSREAWGRYVF